MRTPENRPTPGQTGLDSRALTDAAGGENYLGDPEVIAAMLQVFLIKYYELVERVKADDKIDYEAAVNELIEPHVGILQGSQTGGYTPMIGWNKEGGVIRALVRRFGVGGTPQEIVRFAFWTMINRVQAAEDAATAGEDFQMHVDAVLEDFGLLLSGVRIMPPAGTL